MVDRIEMLNTTRMLHDINYSVKSLRQDMKLTYGTIHGFTRFIIFVRH